MPTKALTSAVLWSLADGTVCVWRTEEAEAPLSAERAEGYAARAAGVEAQLAAVHEAYAADREEWAEKSSDAQARIAALYVMASVAIFAQPSPDSPPAAIADSTHSQIAALCVIVSVAMPALPSPPTVTKDSDLHS